MNVLTDDKKYSEYIKNQFAHSRNRHVKRALIQTEASQDSYAHASFFDQLWQQRGRTERFFCSFQKKKLKQDSSDEE